MIFLFSTWNFLRFGIKLLDKFGIARSTSSLWPTSLPTYATHPGSTLTPSENTLISWPETSRFKAGYEGFLSLSRVSKIITCGNLLWAKTNFLEELKTQAEGAREKVSIFSENIYFSGENYPIYMK